MILLAETKIYIQQGRQQNKGIFLTWNGNETLWKPNMNQQIQQAGLAMKVEFERRDYHVE